MDLVTMTTPREKTGYLVRLPIMLTAFFRSRLGLRSLSVHSFVTANTRHIDRLELKDFISTMDVTA